MGTKLKPGAFDCYANAAPDEPMFVLLARDESAPAVVRDWVRARELRKGHPWPTVVDPALPQFDEKAREALACADAMEKWARSAVPSEKDDAVEAALDLIDKGEQLQGPSAVPSEPPPKTAIEFVNEQLEIHGGSIGAHLRQWKHDLSKSSAPSDPPAPTQRKGESK